MHQTKKNGGSRTTHPKFRSNVPLYHNEAVLCISCAVAGRFQRHQKIYSIFTLCKVYHNSNF